MSVDQKIIDGCRKGKRQAQNRLYHLFAGAMLGICLRYAGNVAEAEDILQEGFIKVFSNISKLKDDRALPAWIRRIMVNTAITHAMSKKIHFDALRDDVAAPQDLEEETYQPVEPEVLLGIIQHLPEGYRMVLNMHVFDGYSHKEIAQALHISESTSKTQLYKARKAIRKELEQHMNKHKHLVDDETRI